MNHKILIAEDNYLVAFELELLLQKQGYQVETCSYGEEAIEIARRSTPPKLYIIDVGLKGEIDGIAAAKAIKNIHPQAKFIFISGHEDKISLGDSDMDMVNSLVKPIDNEHLLDIVEKNLSKSHIHSSQKTHTMQNLRILIVENDYKIAEVFKSKIEKRLHISNIDICAYGEEAVERARNPESAPHLYLMDIKLRGDMDGLESAIQIKEITPNAQFIFMSGHEDKIAIAKEQGVVILLPKPVEADDMLKEVLRMLPTLEFFFEPYVLKNSILVYKNDAETGHTVERIRIKAEDILVLKTGGGTTTIYTKGSKNYFITAGLTSLMNKWNERASGKELPNSLHRIVVIIGYNDGAVKYSNEESGSRFISLSERYCPYFKDMLINLMSGG